MKGEVYELGEGSRIADAKHEGRTTAPKIVAPSLAFEEGGEGFSALTAQPLPI